MKKLILVLAASLAGCAPQVGWSRPGMTRDSYTQDANDCAYEVAKATAGYSVNAASGISLYGFQERKNELEQMCMKSKGYRLVPKS